jgi:hypothetical protein
MQKLRSRQRFSWFKVLEYPHSSFAIMMRCLTEWGIRDKLFTSTLDNVGNNTTTCEELVTNHEDELEGEHLHVRCSAHILNILVQDGMLVIHTDTAIKKLHELLKHIDSSLS